MSWRRRLPGRGREGLVIRLQVLGPIELEGADGRELRAVLAQPKRLALLAYLAAAPRGFHRRDTLLALFWPELHQPRARTALNQAIRFLRRELGDSSAEIIVSRGAEEVGVDGQRLWCDAVAFADHSDAGRYAQALELYRSDLLAGFFADGGAAFEEWIERERARLRSMAAKAARGLAEAREREGNFTTAVASARRAVDLSDADERIVRGLLELLDRLGDRAGAIHAYETFVRRLAEEFDAEPDPETQAVMHRIRGRVVAASRGGEVLDAAARGAVGDATIAGAPNAAANAPAVVARQVRPAVALTPTLSPATGESGAELNGWRIERELGRGGMATVYLARDPKHDRQVALKVMRPELAVSLGAERFLREIQIMARLAHPHILPLIDSGSADGALYLVAPYIAGETLRDRLARERKLAVDEALEITRQVASALEYAHRQGVVHRDIKPANILLQDGRVVVADFGVGLALSASGEERVTATGLSPGTPSYMSPEQAAGGVGVDARSDVYSLGCVLYEMLTGEPPHAGTEPGAVLARVLTEPARPVRELRDDVPSHVEAALGRSLAKLPDDRFPSAGAFARALDEGSHHEPARSPLVTERSANVRRDFRRAVYAYVLAFAGVVAAAWGTAVGIGLPDWVVPGAALVMALGLPMVLLTGIASLGAGQAEQHAATRTDGGPRGIAGLAARVAPHLSWRRTVVGGVAALGTFSLAVGGYMASRALGIGPAGSLFAKRVLAPKEPLLITDFRVSGVDSSVGIALAYAVRTALAESRDIGVAAGDIVTGALERMRRPSTSTVDLSVAREIAVRQGIRAIVDGHVIRTGSRYNLGLRLVSADSGSELVALNESAATLDDLIPTAADLTRKLRAQIGESLKSVRASPPLDQVTTASMEALRLYTAGLRAPDYQTALSLARQAVAIDTTFAEAWRRLFIMGTNMGVQDDSAIVRAYRYRSNASEIERLRIEETYFNRYVLDRARSVEVLEQLLMRDSGYGLIALGERMRARRQLVRAESLARASVRRAPDHFLPYNNLADYLLEQGNKLDEAERTLDAGLSRTPQAWELHGRKIWLMYHRGQLDAFERALDSVRALPNVAAREGATPWRRDLALVRGRLAEFERLGGETGPPGPRVIRIPPRFQIPAMIDLWIRNDTASAIRRVYPLPTSPSLTPLQYLQVGVFLATAGRPALARQLLARADAASDTMTRRQNEPWVHRLRGEVALAEGRTADAVAAIREGDQLPDGPVDACTICFYVSLAYAFDRANLPDSAIAMYERYVDTPFGPRWREDRFHLARVLTRLGELHESRGNREKAIHYYSRFVDLWKNADPELQPRVAEVHRRLARL